ncbi:MAG: M3 family metallopeptidase [Fidelibacterota bacterium]
MRKFVFLFLTIVLVLSGCVPPESHEEEVSLPKRSNPLLFSVNETIHFADLKEGDILKATNAALAKADLLLNDILAVEDESRTFDNTILLLDDLYNVIGKVDNPAGLMSEVHPVASIREEADSSMILLSKYMNELSVNEELYKAIVTFGETEEGKKLSGVEKKYLEDEIRSFERQGIALPEDKRQELTQIKNNLTKLLLEFSKNISEYADTLVVTREQMEGTPEWYKKAMFDSSSRAYKIDISYPSRRVFMRYSKSKEARYALSEKFLNRAADKNLSLIPKICKERQKIADLLGYPTYAAYVLAERMPKKPETVWDFEIELRNALKEKSNQELSELLAFKMREEGIAASEIDYWELHYLENIRAEEKYHVDEEEVKQYFELETVLKGLFEITQQVFGLTYRPVENPSVWHPEVLMYQMYDSETGDLMGQFYLDLYPRANKYSHAAMFSLVKGKRIGEQYQHPVASLVTNFPKPSDELPSLLSHDEAETFFHEFGHLIHGLVTTTDYYSFSGTSVDRDFVEAPSQILENWVWNKETLKLFAKHYKTGNTIPDELLDRMLAAKNKSSGGDYSFQVFLGTLDMTLHDGKWDPENETVVEVAQRLHKEILNWNETPGTARIASFGHLAGYAASYYGYAWSRVLAQDMFSIFEKEGILNPDTGKRFRNTVLAPGGSKDPMNLVQEFLGREPNNKAFMRSLGL